MSQVQMVFWDVQHGHATYIRTPNDRHIVIDLGTGDYSGRDEAFSPLTHLRTRYNVSRLDYVVITHPHRDHIDDILNFDMMSPKVLHRPKSIPNSKLMENVRQQDYAKFAKYCEINDRYVWPIEEGSLNDTNVPHHWGGVDIRFFQPPDKEATNINDHSIVTVIDFEGYKAVIPGDNEKASLEQLMQNPNFIEAVKDADVLLAPHHGRDSGYLAAFVRLVNPRISIVSDGRFCETSANQCYSAMSRGTTVRTGTYSEERKCLTTNSDGEIYVNFGRDQYNDRFLHIKKAEEARAQTSY